MTNPPEHNYQPPPRRFATFPPVIKWVIILCTVTFIVQLVPAINNFLIQYGALWPLGTPMFVREGNILQLIPRFEGWQLISYSFIHGGLAHITMNMFALWMFGATIENSWGGKRFFVYYFVCVLGAGLLQLAVSYGQVYPTVGASGGVFQTNRFTLYWCRSQ